MATPEQTLAFKNDLYTAYSDYMDSASDKERYAMLPYDRRMRVILATVYYQILIDYLEPADDLDENFFTPAEGRDILEHFNRITDAALSYAGFE